MMLSTAIPLSSSCRSYLDLPTFTLPAGIHNESALVIRIHHLGTWVLEYFGGPTKLLRHIFHVLCVYLSQ